MFPIPVFLSLYVFVFIVYVCLCLPVHVSVELLCKTEAWKNLRTGTCMSAECISGTWHSLELMLFLEVYSSLLKLDLSSVLCLYIFKASSWLCLAMLITCSEIMKLCSVLQDSLNWTLS